MINMSTAGDVLAKAMSTGADFAEIFCELTRSGDIQLVGGKIERIGDDVLSGVGIRVFRGTQTVYASTCDVSREGLLRCAQRVADVISETTISVNLSLTESIVTDIHPVKIDPVSAGSTFFARVALLLRNMTSISHRCRERLRLFIEPSGSLTPRGSLRATITPEPEWRSPRWLPTRVKISREAARPDAVWVSNSLNCILPARSVLRLPVRQW